MCLGNIFKNFTANNMKKIRLNGYIYDFLDAIIILLILIILSIFIIFDEKTLHKIMFGFT